MGELPNARTLTHAQAYTHTRTMPTSLTSIYTCVGIKSCTWMCVYVKASVCLCVCVSQSYLDWVERERWVFKCVVASHRYQNLQPFKNFCIPINLEHSSQHWKNFLEMLRCFDLGTQFATFEITLESALPKYWCTQATYSNKFTCSFILTVPTQRPKCLG